MSVNNYRPHLLVIPEDDANRQIANGFALEVLHGRQLQILPEAGGWSHVCDAFLQNHQKSMARFPKRYVLLLLDFDDQPNRRDEIEARIPAEYKSRVFLLGARGEPEALVRAGFGTFEVIGRALAVACREQRWDPWRRDLLRDNTAELEGLRTSVRPFLFDPD